MQQSHAHTKYGMLVSLLFSGASGSAATLLKLLLFHDTPTRSSVFPIRCIKLRPFALAAGACLRERVSLEPQLTPLIGQLQDTNSRLSLLVSLRLSRFVVLLRPQRSRAQGTHHFLYPVKELSIWRQLLAARCIVRRAKRHLRAADIIISSALY